MVALMNLDNLALGKVVDMAGILAGVADSLAGVAGSLDMIGMDTLVEAGAELDEYMVPGLKWLDDHVRPVFDHPYLRNKAWVEDADDFHRMCNNELIGLEDGAEG